jgi:hypothetical protein
MAWVSKKTTSETIKIPKLEQGIYCTFIKKNLSQAYSHLLPALSMITENNEERNLRVFISYAREDTDAANRLYNDLKLSGLDPWLDTQSLLGGENWRIAVRDAIRKSRYFIPILSSNSVEKIGYVQRELKEALEVLLEFPQSKRFVIPAPSLHYRSFTLCIHYNT